MEQTGLCDVCGRADRLRSCALCGRRCCPQCYVPETGTCTQCRRGRTMREKGRI